MYSHDIAHFPCFFFFFSSLPFTHKLRAVLQTSNIKIPAPHLLYSGNISNINLPENGYVNFTPQSRPKVFSYTYTASVHRVPGPRPSPRFPSFPSLQNSQLYSLPVPGRPKRNYPYIRTQKSPSRVYL